MNRRNALKTISASVALIFAPTVAFGAPFSGEDYYDYRSAKALLVPGAKFLGIEVADAYYRKWFPIKVSEGHARFANLLHHWPRIKEEMEAEGATKQ